MVYHDPLAAYLDGIQTHQDRIQGLQLNVQPPLYLQDTMAGLINYLFLLINSRPCQDLNLGPPEYQADSYKLSYPGLDIIFIILYFQIMVLPFNRTQLLHFGEAKFDYHNGSDFVIQASLYYFHHKKKLAP